MDHRFTYHNFVTNNVFSLLDPIFLVIFLFSILLLIMVCIKKTPIWLCAIFASLTVIVSGQLLWFSAIIVDELGIGGSTEDFILFMGILVTQFLALYITVLKSYKKEKNRNTH
ncbi:hypothetical protein U1P98_16310 [Lysinibacillus irui]|uniref:Uncharacterized protein n=1 Tax=Lysinibacillus irui TaxID=2998077 RepID=A0ABU5NPA7_9BACI|nr:hypothetical protein [Lysinibacillus irui]MEA0551947.1 hypothetical protein [Lysinibacillus irui]MEA0977872.1 hypothetical protein [Lysinibacillus irui]MEA1044026.1 hypothetical protein [Lysinibacillus irui]